MMCGGPFSMFAMGISYARSVDMHAIHRKNNCNGGKTRKEQSEYNPVSGNNWNKNVFVVEKQACSGQWTHAKGNINT